MWILLLRWPTLTLLASGDPYSYRRQTTWWNLGYQTNFLLFYMHQWQQLGYFLILKYSWNMPLFVFTIMANWNDMSFWYFINCACISQIGSPTALSSQELETSLRTAAIKHGLYVPSGAFWGAEDIKKMADRGTLQVRHVFWPARCLQAKVNLWINHYCKVIPSQGFLRRGADQKVLIGKVCFTQ